MTEVQASSGTIERQERLAVSERRRLVNLGKLYHVPVIAIREMLESRVADQKFGHLNQAELIVEVNSQAAVTSTDVEELYEDYRYGQRLSFYLYLLPTGLPEPECEEIQQMLDRLITDDPDVQRLALAGDYEAAVASKRISLLEEGKLGDLREIGFCTHHPHRFVNVDGEPDLVLQTQYGFFWLDLALGYLVIFSRDEGVNDLLKQALSRCLRAIPLSVRFPKELVDKHFSIERAKRLSYYDPGTGVRRSISGRGLWQRYEHEILDQEQQYMRPASLYDEEVAEGVTSGLGVTASKGKIYLTKPLPISLVRVWGMQRLPELVRDLKDLKGNQPDALGGSIEAIKRMRLRSAGKAAIVTIVQSLLRADREGLTSVDLDRSALEIYEQMKGKYFDPYLRAQCSECDETAELCPDCESNNLDAKKQPIACKACGVQISNGDFVTLICLNGHITRAPLADAFSMAPNHWLQKRMSGIFDELGQPWDEQADYFHIEGNTLYRLRKGQMERDRLPQIVQNYINNFWDPVAGQVHTGSGDLVVGNHLEDRQPEQTIEGDTPDSRQDGTALRMYRNFDLRLRRNGGSTYTVEASVPDGGSVLPQPLMLPRDEVFTRRLDAVLHRATGGAEMRHVGESLFDALFPTRIFKLWERTLGTLGEDTGLRLRMHIGPLELMGLPWELLYEEEYIGLRLRFPIIRYLDMTNAPRPLAVRPPLRILVAVAQPEDSPPLDVDSELANIHEALRQLPSRVVVDVLNPVSRDMLLAKLRQGYHVLHYIGHGAFQDGEGYLVLQDPRRQADHVSASLLGQMVADSNLRLAVLNACQTSAVGVETAFGSVAHQLVKAGMPAVIAMQQIVEEQASLAFSHGFYRALAAGWPVEAAVQEARRSIMTALGNGWNEQVDWAIPTLYMRATNGAILGIEAGASGEGNT